MNEDNGNNLLSADKNYVRILEKRLGPRSMIDITALIPEDRTNFPECYPEFRNYKFDKLAINIEKITFPESSEIVDNDIEYRVNIRCLSSEGGYSGSRIYSVALNKHGLPTCFTSFETSGNGEIIINMQTLESDMLVPFGDAVTQSKAYYAIEVFFECINARSTILAGADKSKSIYSTRNMGEAGRG